MAEAEKETRQDFIAAAKALPPTEVFSLKPRTFDEAFRFANLIAESTLIPKEFQKQPANVLIAVQLGMELGVSPMQALQNIYVVNGRPAIFGDLLPAIVIGSGLLEEFTEEGDDKTATCHVKRKGLAAIERTFTMVDAERAGLTRNPTYKSFPKRMLQMRARAYAMRDMFPDVLKGVAIKEDIEDTEPRDVTPEPIKLPQALPKPDAKKAEPKPVDLPRVEKDKPSVAKDRKPAAAKAETAPTEQAEKSQEEIIAECLLWVESCPDEELQKEDGNWLMAEMRKVKGTENQLKILRPFNSRRQALSKASA